MLTHAILQRPFYKTTNTPGVLDHRLRDNLRLYGVEAFSLEVLETDPTMTREEILRELATLTELWRATFDPALLY